LKPSSELTALDDDTIIIRFGGDKGGDFMKFKFGFTVMNYLQTNSPDAFELCLSLDAPDTYFNLKTLFDLKMEEFEFFFELETPAFCLPSVFLLDSEARYFATSSTRQVPIPLKKHRWRQSG
jgi:hypothetical protein